MGLWQIGTTVYSDQGGQLTPIMTANPGTYPEPDRSFLQTQNVPNQISQSGEVDPNAGEADPNTGEAREYGGWYWRPELGRAQRWWGPGVWTEGEEPSPGASPDRADRGTQQQDQEAQRQVDEKSVEKNLEEIMTDIIDDFVTRQDEIMSNMSLVLTEEEKEEIEKNAIELTKPFFEKEKKNLEQKVKNDEISDLQDLIFNIKEDARDFQSELDRIDLTNQESEESFANTLADITGNQDYATKKAQQDWVDRIREVKQTQVEQGRLTGGRGRERVSDLEERRREQLGEIQRRAGQMKTEAKTSRKFDKERARLAREQVESRREAAIGTPQEQEDAISQARSRLTETGESGRIEPRRQTLLGQEERQREQFSEEQLESLRQRQEERRLRQETSLRSEKRIQKQAQIMQQLESSRRGLSEDLRKRLKTI